MSVSDEIIIAAPDDRDVRVGLVSSHRFADELPELCQRWQADPAPSAELVVLDDALAGQLGLDADVLAAPAGVALLAGNAVPEGAEPVALAYAGHQFGHYSPRLGDGRALLLGELDTPDGLVDLHLKGSGRTPFARGGDGKATLGPMLREYLVAHSLHALGVPTTRSLAVVTTGEAIWRDGAEPGAVLTRVAASHIRVGTFEYAVRLGGTDLVRRLADHAIARHHPGAWDADNPYVGLLESVIDAQADLVARWMLVGFVHGVMNTDNMTISGEGIDYGPCAFIDRYDPGAVFSSIDHAGRYAFGNQPKIAAWNLARFAETLLGLFLDEPEEAVEVATALVQDFPNRFASRWRAGMAAKLGLAALPDDDPALFDDLTETMQADGLDWTGTFRRLAGDLRDRSEGTDASPTGGGEPDEAGSPAWQRWKQRWIGHLEHGGRPLVEVAGEMDQVNPVHIPRNHLVDEALTAATDGDLDPFHRLAEVLADPFGSRPGDDRFAQPASEAFTESFVTFCGT